MLKKLLIGFGICSVINLILTFGFSYFAGALPLRASISLAVLMFMLTFVIGYLVYFILVQYTIEMFPKEEYVITFPDDVIIESDYD